MGFTGRAVILKEPRGNTPKHSLLKPMTALNNTYKATTAVLCAGLIGATTCAFAPAAEARSYGQELYELKQLRKEIRRETRNYQRERRQYRHEVNRYPRVIPAYGLRYGNVYREPAGFGIQLRF